MNIAIIPARGASKRIPGKNFRTFHGKPIIEYSLAIAKESGLFERIWISGDEVAANYAHYHGHAWISRSSEYLLGDVSGTQEVMADAVRYQRDHDIACCIYPTSPLMSVEDLRRGYEQLSFHHFAFSVGTNPLCDAGQFYWGHVLHFRKMRPLISPDSAMIPIAVERVCDINVETDWLRAELMYEALHREKA